MAKPQPCLSKAEFNAQYKAAVERGKRAWAAGQYAEAAWYDPTTARLMLTLSNGVLVGIPIAGITYLKDATPAQLQAVELTPTGSGVSWRALDVDLGVPGLIRDAFGTQVFARALGQMGGRATSPAKARSSKVNGAKGGRPRKHAA